MNTVVYPEPHQDGKNMPGSTMVWKLDLPERNDMGIARYIIMHK
jgi:hypothetical protein